MRFELGNELGPARRISRVIEFKRVVPFWLVMENHHHVVIVRDGIHKINDIRIHGFIRHHSRYSWAGLVIPRILKIRGKLIME